MTRRRVEISDDPHHSTDRSDLGPVKLPPKMLTQSVPTGDIRHLGHIREGRISFEVFSRARRESIPVDFDIQEGGGKADNASKKLQEGRKESSVGDEKDLRSKKGTEGVLRDGQQTRSRKKQDSKSEQRISKASGAKARKKLKKRG